MNEPSAPVRGTALLTKALDIVELISDSDNRLKFKDIAERTGHSKSTLYRILSALSARGMIDIDQRDQSYVLGPKFTEMAGSINSSSDLIAVCAGPLKALADQHGENVNLSILLGTAQVTISRWQGRLGPAFTSPLGERKPLYATGLGKCLLSFLPEPEREAVMARLRLTAYTAHTITDLPRLREDIEITRARGFAMDDNEIIDGVVCVSTPILSAEGRPLASVSLTGPAHRMTPARRLELASVLQMTTRRISQLLIPQRAPHPVAADLPSGGRVELIDARAFSSRALGESAAWGGLVWFDGPGGRVQVERAGAGTLIHATDRITAAALGEDDEILLIADGALMRIAPGAGTAERLRSGPEFETARDIACLGSGMVAVLSGERLLVTARDGGRSHELAAGLDPGAGIAPAPDDHALLAVRAADNRVLRLDPVTGASRALPVPGTGRITGLCFDLSGRIWVAFAQSWSLCLYDPDGGKAQHIAVPIPSLQGLVAGTTPSSVHAGSDRYTMSQSLIEAAPSSGGVLTIRL